MKYGVCQNAENRCEFSYRSRQLAHLHDLLQLIHAQELRGTIASEAEKLKWFARYFQTGAACKACGQVLCISLLSTRGLDYEAEEYEKRIRLNHLLALTGELQARGVLTA